MMKLCYMATAMVSKCTFITMTHFSRSSSSLMCVMATNTSERMGLLEE